MPIETVQDGPTWGAESVRRQSGNGLSHEAGGVGDLVINSFPLQLQKSWPSASSPTSSRAKKKLSRAGSLGTQASFRWEPALSSMFHLKSQNFGSSLRVKLAPGEEGVPSTCLALCSGAGTGGLARAQEHLG